MLLDTREPVDFGAGHLRGAIDVGLQGRFAEWAGDVLDPDRDIVLVGDPATAHETKIRLARIGFDRVAGQLRDAGNVLVERPDLAERSSRAHDRTSSPRSADSNPISRSSTSAIPARRRPACSRARSRCRSPRWSTPWGASSPTGPPSSTARAATGRRSRRACCAPPASTTCPTSSAGTVPGRARTFPHRAVRTRRTMTVEVPEVTAEESSVARCRGRAVARRTRGRRVAARATRPNATHVPMREVPGAHRRDPDRSAYRRDLPIGRSVAGGCRGLDRRGFRRRQRRLAASGRGPPRTFRSRPMTVLPASSPDACARSSHPLQRHIIPTRDNVVMAPRRTLGARGRVITAVASIALLGALAARDGRHRRVDGRRSTLRA